MTLTFGHGSVAGTLQHSVPRDKVAVGSAAGFWPEALPYAQQAHAATGVLVSVILAQWADETEYGGPDWSIYHNPGNVGDNVHAGQLTYPTLESGVEGYIHCMLQAYYVHVRQAVGYTAQCYALGQSPWAGGHYDADGGPPGTDLVKIIVANNLTQYDSAQPAPAPTPEPAPTPTPAPTTFTPNVLEELLEMTVSDPDLAVRWAYRFCLHREVDGPGYAANMAWLAAGGSVGKIVQNLQDSAEGQAVIAKEQGLYGVNLEEFYGPEPEEPPAEEPAATEPLPEGQAVEASSEPVSSEDPVPVIDGPVVDVETGEAAVEERPTADPGSPDWPDASGTEVEIEPDEDAPPPYLA